MKNLEDLFTVRQVDEFIDEICRNLSPDACVALRARAEASNMTSTERAKEPKLDAVCKALERRVELQKEVRESIRDLDGHVNVRV